VGNLNLKQHWYWVARLTAMPMVYKMAGSVQNSRKNKSPRKSEGLFVLLKR
jgi:hypothetical protein